MQGDAGNHLQKELGFEELRALILHFLNYYRLPQEERRDGSQCGPIDPILPTSLNRHTAPRCASPANDHLTNPLIIRGPPRLVIRV